MSEIIPKQALDTKLQDASNAIADLVSKVDVSITEVATTEGSVINLKIGTEKDGFTSLSVATTKGSASEGPSIALMGSNIKEGNITKTVSASAKLNSVTGGLKGTTAVLDETIVQGNLKGMRSALKEIAKVDDSKIINALKDASPIPASAASALQTEIDGGIITKAAANASKASVDVGTELENPFGSSNPFGAVGSAFGNIMAQVTALAANSPKYTSPLTELKASTASQVLTKQNTLVDTPNVVTTTGATNIKNVATKSKIEATDTELITKVGDFKPGESTVGWNGILTRLAALNDGGQYKIPAFNSSEAINAELRAIERPISQLIVWHWPSVRRSSLFLEELHIKYRAKALKDYGDAAVTANPKNYALAFNMHQNRLGAIQIYRPLEEEIRRKAGAKDPFPNALIYFIDADAERKLSPAQSSVFGQFIDEFIDVFPGAEIVGLNEVSERTVFDRVPYFNIRDIINSRSRKPSVMPDTPGEPIEVPSPSELADLIPKNIKIPKLDPNVREQMDQKAARLSKTISTLPEGDYLKTQEDALGFLKQKTNEIASADKLTGNGLGGINAPQISSLNTTSSSLLKNAQGLKLDQLKNNKIFDAVKGIFKNV